MEISCLSACADRFQAFTAFSSSPIHPKTFNRASVLSSIYFSINSYDPRLFPRLDASPDASRVGNEGLHSTLGCLLDTASVRHSTVSADDLGGRYLFSLDVSILRTLQSPSIHLSASSYLFDKPNNPLYLQSACLLCISAVRELRSSSDPSLVALSISSSTSVHPQTFPSCSISSASLLVALIQLNPD